MEDEYEVFVSRDTFKFTASHFIAFKGYRERMHGHNYSVGVRILGNRGPDGYVIDFGNIKKILSELCKELNQHVLIPLNSDVLTIKVNDLHQNNIDIFTEDNSYFSLPKGDCMMLPIVHTSAEEIAEFLVDNMILKFASIFSDKYLREERGVTKISVSVSEAPNQTATCTRYLNNKSSEIQIQKRATCRACSSLES